MEFIPLLHNLAFDHRCKRLRRPALRRFDQLDSGNTRTNRLMGIFQRTNCRRNCLLHSGTGTLATVHRQVVSGTDQARETMVVRKLWTALSSTLDWQIALLPGDFGQILPFERTDIGTGKLMHHALLNPDSTNEDPWVWNEKSMEYQKMLYRWSLLAKESMGQESSRRQRCLHFCKTMHCNEIFGSIQVKWP